MELERVWQKSCEINTFHSSFQIACYYYKHILYVLDSRNQSHINCTAIFRVCGSSGRSQLIGTFNPFSTDSVPPNSAVW